MPPSATQKSMDSDIRLRGMGSLDLPVEDESNLLGTFKYSGLWAGTTDDYPRSKAELSHWSNNGDHDQNSTRVYENDQSALSGMMALRFETEKKDPFVIGLGLTSESSEQKQVPLIFPNEPSYKKFQAGFGRQTGPYLYGVGLQKVDWERSSFLGLASDGVSYTSIDPSVGYVVDTAQDKKWTFMGGLHIRSGDYEYTNFPNRSESIGGLGLSGAAQFDWKSRLRAIVDMTMGNTDGERMNNGLSSDFTKSTQQLRGRTFYRCENLPVNLGALLSVQKADMETPTGVSNDEQMVAGLGAAIHFLQNRALLGTETRTVRNKSELSGNKQELNGQWYSLGGELQVVTPLWLRMGFRYFDGTRKIQIPTAERDITANEYSAGAEYRFEDKGAISLAYTHSKWDGSRSIPVFVPEELTSDSILLTGKIYFHTIASPGAATPSTPPPSVTPTKKKHL